MKKWLKNQKGLTLVELLAVIVILGIIAAIAVPAIGNIIENSRKDSQIANAEAMFDSARLAQTLESEQYDFYFAINDGDALGDNTLDLKEDYLDAIPGNPHGDAYTEAYVEVNNGEFEVTLKSGSDIYFDEVSISTIRTVGRDGFDGGTGGEFKSNLEPDLDPGT